MQGYLGQTLSRKEDMGHDQDWVSAAAREFAQSFMDGYRTC